MTGHARVHLLNGADGREDLPGRAVAALKPIAVQEGGLHRVKLVACGEAFNRDDVLALARRRQRQTGQDTLAVDDDRARAARALIASLLRAGQTEHVAESVQQRQARESTESSWVVLLTRILVFMSITSHFFIASGLQFFIP